MYEVGRWNEEKIIQGLAVAMCIAMVGMAVIPVVSVGAVVILYDCESICFWA